MTGVQFEISIDGIPRTYRDRKDLALLAAQILKSRNPNSVVKLKDLQTGGRDRRRVQIRKEPSRSARPASAPGSTRTARTSLSNRGGLTPRSACWREGLASESKR